MISLTPTAAARTAGVPDEQIKYTYDYMSRRVRKQVYINSAASYDTLVRDQPFIYQGWNLIAEIIGTDEGAGFVRTAKTYVWGLDMSQSWQGAGGVGGLLSIHHHSDPQNPATAESYLPAYDGNNNILGLVMADTGGVVAEYEYDPFGKPWQSSGPAAETNPFRFSTKYTEDESGLVYYGYRFFDPNTGRWLNRDPIGEDRGIHLYGFVKNSAVDVVDYLGLRGNRQFCGGQQYNPCKSCCVNGKKFERGCLKPTKIKRCCDYENPHARIPIWPKVRLTWPEHCWVQIGSDWAVGLYPEKSYGVGRPGNDADKIGKKGALCQTLWVDSCIDDSLIELLMKTDPALKEVDIYTPGTQDCRAWSKRFVMNAAWSVTPLFDFGARCPRLGERRLIE